MLVILENIEKKLKSLKVSNVNCDKIISKSPSFLKVVRRSSSLQLTTVLASIKELILHEKISIVICDCPSIYTMDRNGFDYLYRTLRGLPQTCNVAVVFVCYILPEMPAFKFPAPADLYWSISRSSSCSRKFYLSVKKSFDKSATTLERDFIL